MTNKEIYAQLCEQYSDINLFMQYWWLSAVCAGKQWDVMFTKDAEGNISAALPYLHGKRLWMKYVLMPQQTQIGGIWIRPDLVGNIEATQTICQDFHEQLQALKLAYYYQHFELGSLCPNIFKVLNYKVKEKATYRINDLSNLDQVIDSFSKNKKRQLQKALSLHVDLNMDAEDFYRFHSECLTLQKKEISYAREFFLVIYRKACSRKQGQIICIRNANGAALAAAFVVWDAKQMYYLIPCYSPIYKESGAGALLVLECIKFARNVTAAFDFEGSSIRGVANHYKQFGSTCEPFYAVSKCNSPIFYLLLGINWLKNRKKR